LSVFTNISFNLSKYMAKGLSVSSLELQHFTRSGHAYWETLGALMEATPVGRLPAFFEVHGREHLQQACGRGKGVILLSFHGLPNPARLLPVEKLLGLGRTATLSYHTPRRQSSYHDRQKDVPDGVAETLNAELALFGTRLLQDGKVIQVLSDTNDLQGRTYSMAVARRSYQFKAGFAELALNTGAALIPQWRYFLPDGILRYEFGPPFEAGTGDRAAQVEGLLRQYAAFVEAAWAAHPEAMRWKKIVKHLKRSKSQSSI
jgi:lauroyl/myristoyl acyltransferase